MLDYIVYSLIVDVGREGEDGAYLHKRSYSLLLIDLTITTNFTVRNFNYGKWIWCALPFGLYSTNAVCPVPYLF